MKLFIQILALVLVIISATPVLHAEVKPNSLFDNNAVLQRNRPLPVWGTATDGENISVEFAGQKVSVTAKDGRWRAWLKPLKAGGPFSLTITGNDDRLTFTNILVGDVWLASGQSNMQDPLGPCWWAPPISHWQNEVQAANYPQIRQFKVPMKLSYHREADVNGNWTICSPGTAPDYSAVGYFFCARFASGYQGADWHFVFRLGWHDCRSVDQRELFAEDARFYECYRRGRGHR